MTEELELDAPAIIGPPARVSAVVAAAHSPATLRAYAGAWRAWAMWCEARGVSALPAAPGDVADYLSALALGSRPPPASSVGIILAAMTYAHAAAGVVSPARSPIVQSARRGYRRMVARELPRQGPARALGPEELRAILRALDASERRAAGDRARLAVVRDAAMLALAWHGALRRSEVVGLAARDVVPAPLGMAVELRWSKTGPRTVYVTRLLGDRLACACSWWERWCEARGPVPGDALAFGLNAAENVGRRLRAAAREANVPLERLRGHSLRRGVIAAASEAGIPAADIAGTTGHRSLASLLTYARRESFEAAIGARVLDHARNPPRK